MPLYFSAQEWITMEDMVKILQKLSAYLVLDTSQRHYNDPSGAVSI